MELKQAEGDVELSHVKFGYNSVKTIIHDLSFHVKPGKMIAIVGPTGARKDHPYQSSYAVLRYTGWKYMC